MLEPAEVSPRSGAPSGPIAGPPSFVEVVFRLIACLVVITFGSAYCAAYEATPEGVGRTFMIGLGVFVVPVLWIAGELIGSPVIEFLESRPWWAKTDSLGRIALGVAVTLPLFAFMVAVFWLFRNWFGVPGW